MPVVNAGHQRAEPEPARRLRKRGERHPSLQAGAFGVGKDRIEMIEGPARLKKLDTVGFLPHREHVAPGGVLRGGLEGKSHAIHPPKADPARLPRAPLQTQPRLTRRSSCPAHRPPSGQRSHCRAERRLAQDYGSPCRIGSGGLPSLFSDPRYTPMDAGTRTCIETRNETGQAYPLLAASQSVLLAGSTVGDAVCTRMEEMGGLEAS